MKNKLLTLLTILVALSMLLAACGGGNATPDPDMFEPAAETEAPPVETEAPPTGTPSPIPSREPTPTSTGNSAGITPAASTPKPKLGYDAEPIDWVELQKKNITEVGKIIALLDANPAKVDHSVFPWETGCPNGGLVWSTTKPEQTGLKPWIVDGGLPGTGAFTYEDKGVKILSPGGEACLSNFDGKTNQVAITESTNTAKLKCNAFLDKTMVESIVTGFSNQPAMAISMLDAQAYTNPDMMVGAWSKGEVNLNGGEGYFWTSGKCTGSCEVVFTTDTGIVLYHATGTVQIDHDFNGVCYKK